MALAVELVTAPTVGAQGLEHSGGVSGPAEAKMGTVSDVLPWIPSRCHRRIRLRLRRLSVSESDGCWIMPCGCAGDDSAGGVGRWAVEYGRAAADEVLKPGGGESGMVSFHCYRMPAPLGRRASVA